MIPTLEPRLEWWLVGAMGCGARELRRHVDQLTEGMGWGVLDGGKDGWCPIRIRKKPQAFSGSDFMDRNKRYPFYQNNSWKTLWLEGPIAESLGWFLVCLDVVCCENHIFSNIWGLDSFSLGTSLLVYQAGRVDIVWDFLTINRMLLVFGDSRYLYVVYPYQWKHVFKIYYLRCFLSCTKNSETFSWWDLMVFNRCWPHTYTKYLHYYN